MPEPTTGGDMAAPADSQSRDHRHLRGPDEEDEHEDARRGAGVARRDVAQPAGAQGLLRPRPQGQEVGRVRPEPEVVRAHGRRVPDRLQLCLDLGYFTAHNEGLDEAKAREVPRWRESDAFTPLERDVMEYAEAMSQTPPTVTDELSARLLEGARGAGAGGADRLHRARELFARTNVALGIESRGSPRPAACEPLASRRGVASAA